MNKELENRIKNSAEKIEVPESLLPEAMEKRLEEAKKSDVKSAHPSLYAFYGIAVAAVLFVCCYVLFQNTIYPQNEKNRTENDEFVSEFTNDAVEGDREEASGYLIASSYEEVYDAVITAYEIYNQPFDLADGFAWVEENFALEDAQLGNEAVSADSAPMDAVNSSEMSAGNNGILPGEYSTTNLQVQGVDESDIIKTDGAYLYTVRSNKVYITELQNGVLKAAGTVELPKENIADNILEIYIDGNYLMVIAEGQKSELMQQSLEGEFGDAGEYYFVDTRFFVSLYTYNIENKKAPQLAGKLTQDGYYKTSRKIGNLIYLFTTCYLGNADQYSSREGTEWIPQINEAKIAVDRIYLPERGRQSLIVSSVDLTAPDKIVDNAMIVNNNVDIYVTAKSIYLYNSCWNNSGMYNTEIARFSLEKGHIDAVAASSVNGTVMDTFAVNEYEDSFRILTSNNGDSGNCLYLFDLQLNNQSVLSGIAPDEQIYAARYFGNLVYFVTYRNMDPLFAVDLSDESNPKILGELKITGYSDYLHIWDENSLLGIGYETDPETGRTKGLKIAMFDISDPTELKTIDSLVIQNADYSPALEYYKTVLVNNDANLIGFITENYGTWESNYLLFEWENDSFQNLLTAPIDTDLFTCRGIYVRDTFYIASRDTIISFDRKNEYQEIDRIRIGE